MASVNDHEAAARSRPASPSEEPLGQPVVTIKLRPFGTPLPLGFLALMGGTFTLAGLELGWIAAGQRHDVALVLLGFVFPAQALAAVLGFLARDAVAGTGMGILSVTWLTVGMQLLTTPAGSFSGAQGLIMMMAGLALTVPIIAGGSSKLVATACMGTTAVRFLLTGAYELTSSTSWRYAAGSWGLLLTAVAFYAALSLEIEGQRKKTVLPTFRHRQGVLSMEGTPAEEVEKVYQEAGVRSQL